MNLTFPSNTRYSFNIQGVCMKGRVYLHSCGRYWVIDWWHEGKSRKLYHDFNHKMEKFWRLHPNPELDQGHERAMRCLNTIRTDWEAHLAGKRVFDIEKYLKANYTDVIPFLSEWIQSLDGLTPGGKARYESAVNAWLEPFFKEHPCQMHEIQFNTFKALIKYMTEKGKAPKHIKNTGDALVAFLKYAKKCKRIESLPDFPGKKDYGVKKKPPVWITEEEQIKIIKQIPLEHQPIFWFLKYCWRRKGEAVALLRSDYDPRIDSFIIHRGISDGKIVEYTKDGDIHTIPCVSAFKPWLKERLHDLRSPYMFYCPNTRLKDKHYTYEILDKLWKDAREAAGIEIKIGIHDGLRKSNASYALNIKKMNKFDVQAMGDWADVRSVEHYADYELERRRDLMESMGEVIPLPDKKPTRERSSY